jgi:4-hydroxy-3-methylbut-2-enyl diphosphate reductase
MTVIAAPLRVEQAALHTARAAVVRTGMGRRRSLAAARHLGEEAVLVAGVGGGLRPDVRVGDVVVATSVVAPDGSKVACPSAELLAGELRRLGLSVHCGPICSSPTVVDGASRHRLAATGALAVDMESAWLAPPLASRGRRPFAVVRAISDTEGDSLVRPGIVIDGFAALRSLRRAVPALDAWASATSAREVALASPRSFCAGVERAIDIVARALDRYGPPVYVRRQIVHNVHVVRELEQRGAVFVEEAGDAPPGAVLVLAAHGVAPSVRAEAAARGQQVIDATCPLVTKVHAEVRRYAGRDTTVFLIGHADHEEVVGTVGEAPSSIVVVGDVDAAATVAARNPAQVAYVTQTTLATDEAEGIIEVLRGRFPALQGPPRDDICYATTNRQQAVRRVAGTAELVLVVGSANSSNSLRLVEVARREGARARLVEDAGDLPLAELAGVTRIGITAGASAPPHLVDDLIAGLRGLGPLTLTESDAEPEQMHFTLPKEVT